MKNFMKKLIIDTDMGPDCDDAGALAVAHALADKGEAKILAVNCATSSKGGARCIQAINTYYGREDILVGELKDKDFCCLPHYELFNNEIGKPFEKMEFPSAVTVMRRVLAAEEGVTLVTIGPLRNIYQFMKSEPDEISPLSGMELLKRLDRVVCVGGDYKVGNREFNFVSDITASRYFLEKCPVPILFSGYEIGVHIPTGAILETRHKDNPVRRAYEIFAGKGKNHTSFDLTAVYCAVRDPEPLFKVVSPVTAVIRSDETTAVKKGGKDAYLKEKMPPDKVGEILDELLITRP